jgi:hypothetical protein
MTMNSATVSVSIVTLDGHRETDTFDTLKDAMPYLNQWLGSMWDHGNSYAVNAFGDVTVYLEGATWEEYKRGRMVE